MRPRWCSVSAGTVSAGFVATLAKSFGFFGEVRPLLSGLPHWRLRGWPCSIGFQICRSLICLLGTLGLPLCLPMAASAQATVALEQTPAAIRNGSAKMVAHYSPERMLRLVIALQAPRMEDEESFLRGLQDPNSPNFHKYLTETEWNARFAPSVEDEAAVVAWAQSQGFTITQRFSNRLLVDVE